MGAGEEELPNCTSTSEVGDRTRPPKEMKIRKRELKKKWKWGTRKRGTGGRQCGGTIDKDLRGVAYPEDCIIS